MSYKLIKSKKNFDKIYKLICKNITSSIFISLGFGFFKYLVLEDIIQVYSVKKKNKISAVITIVNCKNYKLINKYVIYYLILNPTKLIKNFFKLIKSIGKTSKININKNYLHLLHLIIFKKDFNNISLKKKDFMFNKFYKKILEEHKAKVLFLCFKKNNKRALNYYSRNNFKYFHKIKDIFYFRKKYNI